MKKIILTVVAILFYTQAYAEPEFTVGKFKGILGDGNTFSSQKPSEVQMAILVDNDHVYLKSIKSSSKLPINIEITMTASEFKEFSKVTLAWAKVAAKASVASLEVKEDIGGNDLVYGNRVNVSYKTEKINGKWWPEIIINYEWGKIVKMQWGSEREFTQILSIGGIRGLENYARAIANYEEFDYESAVKKLR